MDYNQIRQSILNKDYAPIYIFYGEETYFIDQLVKLVEQTILEEAEKSFNQIVLYGRDIDFKTIVDNARQFPMMSERRVVVIREGQHLRDFDSLLSYFENPSNNTVLAIALKGKKPDKRKKIWKTLGKTAVLFDSKRIYENQVPAWVNNYISNSKIKIEPKAAAMMAEFLGANLSRISNELDKMIINTQEGGTITTSDILDQIGIDKDYNIFELQNALGEKNSQKAFRIVKYFADNEKSHPVYMILPSLNSYFTKLAMAQEYINANDSEFMRKVGIGSRFFLNSYKTAARKYSPAQIKKAFKYLYEADLKAKGIGSRHKNDLGLYQELIFGILSN